MKILDELKSAIANLSESAEEKALLEERREKAQAEITAAAQDKITDKIEARISRASNIVTVCNARLAKLESGSEAEAQQIKALYLEARAAWNKTCETRRELARASFLTACLPHFDYNEKLTAEMLAGILPLPLARISRAGFNGNFRHADDETPFTILSDVQTFIGHVEYQSKQNGIPID
jgi:hypothetical protein